MSKINTPLIIIAVLAMLCTMGYLVYSNIQLRKELTEYRMQAVKVPPILPVIDSTLSVVNLKVDSLNTTNTALNEKQIRYLRSLIKRGNSVKKIDITTPAGIDSLIQSLNSL